MFFFKYRTRQIKTSKLLQLPFQLGERDGAMGHRIDPSGSGPIELFLIPASAPQLV